MLEKIKKLVLKFCDNYELIGGAGLAIYGLVQHEIMLTLIGVFIYYISYLAKEIKELKDSLFTLKLVSKD